MDYIPPVTIHIKHDLSHPKVLDSSELSARKKVALAKKLSSLVNKEQEIAKQISDLSNTIQPLLNKEEAQRVQHLFPNTLVRPETVQLGKGITQEAAVRATQEKETLDSLEVSQSKAKLHAFLKKQKERVDDISEYVTIGLQVGEQLVTAEGYLDTSESVQNHEFFQSAWQTYEETHDLVEATKYVVKVEFDYWVNMAILCLSSDLEEAKLNQLREKVTEKKQELKQAKTSKNASVAILKNELNQLEELTKAQQKKVDSIQHNKALGALSALTNRGSKYTSAIKEFLDIGSTAFMTLESLSSTLLTGAGAISLITSINTLFTHIDKIEDLKQKIELLDTFQKELLETPNTHDILTNNLISNMLSMKKQHLTHSIEISKSETAFAALNALSATVSVGKLGIALTAALSSTVIMTPGLNVAAAVIATVTVTGIKGKKLYNMLKHDMPGVKLDVQIQEKSAQIYTAAGKFYAEAIRFDALRKECEAIVFKEMELKGSIQTIRDSLTGGLEKAARQELHEPKEEVEEFYMHIRDGLETELAPISVRKLETQGDYELLQEKLYQMSIALDQIVSRKSELHADRSLETMSHEFQHMQKSDILVQYQLFQSSLENETVRSEFVEFLGEEAIPVTEDFIFESALRFVRDDRVLPKSAMKIEEVQ